MQPEAFGRLLELLGPDEQTSAAGYRRLHQRLSRFFEWNGVGDPATLADEAIERLGRRVAENDTGEPIRNPVAFTLGIARLLLQEELRRQQREGEVLRTWEMSNGDPSWEAEEVDQALEHCLMKLPADRRAFIQRYYEHGEMKKAASHQRLAQELGLTINALRNRALRTRQDLEKCIRSYVERSKR